MTRESPDEKCRRCGSWLFLPTLATGMHVPATADCVCVNCGRAYKWEGTPPTLVVMTALATEHRR